MKDKKVFKALKIQAENANIFEYAGVRLATLAIIQAKGLLFADAKEVMEYVGFYISAKELTWWIRI